MESKCKGEGICLRQMDDLNYQKGYGYKCNFQYEPMNCPNYIICGSNYPKWVSWCHGGFCTNCSIAFGSKVEILTMEKEECMICLEEHETMAKFPNCTHHACIGCYKKFTLELK